MPDQNFDDPNLSKAELQDLARTIVETPTRQEPLASRLEHLESLLAAAGPLPAEPVLVWRQDDGTVKYALIGARLVVGRRAKGTGLAFPEDKLLSSTHFAVTNSSEGCELEDLKSLNGTGVNNAKNRLPRKLLRDGDLIFAGKHIFAFLDERRKD